MKKSRSYVLGAAAVIGAALTTTSAPGAMAATGPPVDTTVTFTVTNGDLTISAPSGVALVPGGSDSDSGLPGSTVAATMGDTMVTDNRAALLTPWIATVSETDFTTGTATLPETISAGNATYDPGTVAHTGDITTTGSTVTLSGDAQQVVTDAGSGDNTATWDATITLAIPGTAVVGNYTGTLTSSVG
jgi:hypothetical protein